MCLGQFYVPLSLLKKRTQNIDQFFCAKALSQCHFLTLIVVSKRLKKKQVKAEFRTSLLTHFCEEKDKVGAD